MNKPPINLYLVTSTGCNVRCKTCPAGRKESEPGGIMSMDMLNRILDKATAECRVIGVQLYHYNEPTLIPHMPEMIAECHRRGLPVVLSSNLVVWKNIPAILEQRPDTFLISVSGFTQSVYERSHKTGDIEKVKENMKKMSELLLFDIDKKVIRPLFNQPRPVSVQVSWHIYRYNEHERPLMEELAKECGFKFTPYGTGLIPHDKVMRVWATGIDDPSAEDVLVPVMETKQLCADRKHWDCIIQQQIVAVNGEGKVLLCTNLFDERNLRGDFFAQSIPKFLDRRYQDPVCKACKAVGGHVYATQSYTRSNYSPLRLAESAYRKLGLQGRFPWLSRFATQRLYIRPQKRRTL